MDGASTDWRRSATPTAASAHARRARPTEWRRQAVRVACRASTFPPHGAAHVVRATLPRKSEKQKVRAP